MRRTTNTQHAPVTQWTIREREILRALAVGPVRRKAIEEVFPDRTYTAVKSALSKERKRMGVGLGRAENLSGERHVMLDRDDPGLRCAYPERWAAQAASANAQYLAALRA